MKKSEFYFDLPESLIAQTPIKERTQSRLMVMDRNSGNIKHDGFEQVVEYLNSGDCLVLNNTKVIPARLFSTLSNDVVIEFLLLKQLDRYRWEVLVKPGKKAKVGMSFEFGDGELKCVIESDNVDGIRVVRFFYEGIFEAIIDQLGTVPLPPYIKTPLEDISRYNTVYAKHDGSIAAPTAGLHFTKELLQKARDKGVHIAYLTLHVGIGTFRPVKVEDILEHKMHAEFYMLDSENAEIINISKNKGGRVIAVGTTSVRTLECVADERGEIKAQNGWTDIFIYPGYDFKIVDGIITNFHLPESTLIMLVSAFSNTESVLSAYRTAVEEEYRFFSFGDAMLII
jgi:S-adenosylmethionine:tRNA ribosyltransferase-isomerase